MTTKYKTAIVVGATSGTGLALAQQLAAQGTQVLALGRSILKIEKQTQDRNNLSFLSADGADEATVNQLLQTSVPDLIILAGGTQPYMAPISQMSWEEFSAPWNNDTKMAFLWTRALLNQSPEHPVTLLSISSGASLQGSPQSGGYAGAKRMQTLVAQYAQREAEQRALPLSFISVIPKQLIEGTTIAKNASTVYGKAMGETSAEFMAKWSTPLTPNSAAQYIRELLEENTASENTFVLTGEGLSHLE